MTPVESSIGTIRPRARQTEVCDLHPAQVIACRLNACLATVERDCQAWVAEATKVFVVGTEIGDLIRSQFPMTGDYNPPTPPTPRMPPPGP